MQTTGPNVELYQGQPLNLVLIADTAAPAGSTARLVLGARASVRDDYQAALRSDLTVSGSSISGTVQTSTLTGVRYLLQVELRGPAGDLRQVWRGVLLVTGLIPS